MIVDVAKIDRLMEVINGCAKTNTVPKETESKLDEELFAQASQLVNV